MANNREGSIEIFFEGIHTNTDFLFNNISVGSLPLIDSYGIIFNNDGDLSFRSSIGTVSSLESGVTQLTKIESTVDHTLTTDECNGFTIFTNTGAESLINLTLPPANPNLAINFRIESDTYDAPISINVYPGSGDSIQTTDIYPDNSISTSFLVPAIPYISGSLFSTEPGEWFLLMDEL